MEINIENSAEVISALRVALQSMEIDMFRNNKAERTVLSAHLKALEEAVERDVNKEDTHRLVDGFWDPATQHYCVEHDRWEYNHGV